MGTAMIIVGVLSLGGCGDDDPWDDHAATISDVRESLDRTQLRIEYTEIASEGSQEAVLAGTAESPNGQKAAFEIEVYPSASDVTLEDLSYVNRFEPRFGYAVETGALENIAYGRARIAQGRDRTDPSLEVEVMLDDAIFDAFPPDDPNVNPTLTSPFDK